MSDKAITFELPDEIVEALAERVAEILAEREQPDVGFIDVEEAAAFLACPKSRVYSLVSADRLPHHRDGSRLIFDRAELREFVQSGGRSGLDQ